MAQKITRAKTKPTINKQAKSLEVAKSLEITSFDVSTANIREAVDTLNLGRIQPQLVNGKLGSGNGLTEKPGTGGATGRLLENINNLGGFDEGKMGSGNLSEESKESKESAGGSGLLGFDQDQKQTLEDIATDYAYTAGTAGALAAGLPVTAPVTAGLAIAAGVAAGLLHAVAKYGEPVPDEVTGTNPGLTFTGKGVGFDPVTGQGPTRNEKLGQFTGDEMTGSGMIMTQEEYRNFRTAIGQAQGTFLKDPNPMDDSLGSTVIDDRSLQRVDLILSGGGMAGPVGNFAQFADIQSAQFNVAVDALMG